MRVSLWWKRARKRRKGKAEKVNPPRLGVPRFRSWNKPLRMLRISSLALSMAKCLAATPNHTTGMMHDLTCTQTVADVTATKCSLSSHPATCYTRLCPLCTILTLFIIDRATQSRKMFPNSREVRDQSLKGLALSNSGH